MSCRQPSPDSFKRMHAEKDIPSTAFDLISSIEETMCMVCLKFPLTFLKYATRSLCVVCECEDVSCDREKKTDDVDNRCEHHFCQLKMAVRLIGLIGPWRGRVIQSINPAHSFHHTTYTLAIPLNLHLQHVLFRMFQSL